MRGIRGAITVEKNSKDDIYSAAKKLIMEIITRNNISSNDIGAMIFSMTDDLTAAFPSTGVRQIAGLEFVPLFDARQVAVEGSLSRCIRVLVLVETEKSQREIRHVYLERAQILRPDLKN